MPVNSFENYPMSWKPNLDKTTRSLYLTLAKQLEADIQNGILLPGTKLPPQRELADYLDVNVSTISKALKKCELKGLLSATVGSGTFVSYDALYSSNLMAGHRRETIINMGPTSPEQSGNELLLKMAQELLSESQAKCLFSYYSTGADEWQREAAVQLMNYCGHSTLHEQILFSGGGQNALTAILAALFQKGDKIAVDNHTYPGIKTAAAMLGLQLVPVPTDSDGMDMDALEVICKNEKIRGIYVIPACHNPTTAILSHQKREHIANIVARKKLLLIEDGTYQILHKGEHSISNRISEQSIYILSLSKGIAPGLRSAYISVPLKWKQRIEDALYGLNVATAPLLSELAARIITSGQFIEIIRLHQKQTQERNHIVNTYFSKENCLGNENNIFRWLLLPEKYTGADFEALAFANGVQVFGAERFAVGNTTPLKAVRLSICSPDTVEDLEQGIKVISDLIK